MIKFFRKIRKKMADDNRPLQYMRYAFGEIVLVVIGILIALSINNWNEGRKDRIKEQAILAQVKKDYVSNLSQLEEKMATRTRIISSGLRILKDFDQPKNAKRDSLIKNIAIMSSDPTFDPIENDIVSSGNLRLIKNEKLKRLLSNWSSDVVALKEVEVTWSDIANHRLDDVLIELGISRDATNSFLSDIEHTWLLDKDLFDNTTEIGNSKLSAPIDEILRHKGLESMAASAVTYNISSNFQSEALVRRINEIIDLIESEIVVK